MNSSAKTIDFRIQESQETFDLHLLSDWVIENQLPNTEFVLKRLLDREKTIYCN